MNILRIKEVFVLLILYLVFVRDVVAFTSSRVQARLGPKSYLISNGWKKISHRHRFEITPDFSRRNQPSALRSVISNVGVISIASIFGLISERLRFLSGNAGPVLSLFVSALISNALSVTAVDSVVDFCWKLLPASLAFLLISPSNQQQECDDASTYSSAKDTVAAMSIPFIIGSLGSIIGCIISATVLKGGSDSASIFQMRSKNHAIIAAGCLVSSYIGGSVNFFATANIIESQKEHFFPSGCAIDTNDLFTAMATADLLVMAVYFCFLFSIANFKPLQRAFPGRLMNNNDQPCEIALVTHTPSGTNLNLIVSTIVSSLFVWKIVSISDMFEKITSRFVPGTGCAAVACLSTILSWTMKRFGNRKGGSLFTTVAVNFQKDLNWIGPFISNLCFMVLFASIGLTANLQRALQHGASSLLFAFIALGVHLVVILGFSFLFSSMIPQNRFTSKFAPLSLPEVLVASNANIGGASTAAAFASKISKARSLILGATFWGVTGYAVATSIGLSLVRILLQYL